jgi:hypothetical protein
LAQAVEQARQKGSDLRVWAFDEHRIGLKPILRRVWAKRGHRPVVSVQPRYEWRYLHGFVEPSSGGTFWWLTSWVDVEAFNLVLREFAAWCKPTPATPVLLVLDQAGWHCSGDVQVPLGITLIFLPPYSPELQPAERLWPLSNQAICNQRFDTIQDMEDAQCLRCRQLQQQPQLVRAYTRFHWWP